MAEKDGEARLTETTESRQKRGKIHAMYGREEQQELFELEMQGREGQGLRRPDRLEPALDLSAAI